MQYTDLDFAQAGWPKPQKTSKVNRDQLGKLKLTEEKEGAIAAFLKTLSDDYAI